MTYDLKHMVTILLESLAAFKTLEPDAWGHSPWYPLLALSEIEELAYPIVKGRKKILKELKASRQKWEWIIGNYYWALWKWCMKEIHDKDFKFIPIFCEDSLRRTLSTLVPLHLVRLQQAPEEEHVPPPSVNAGVAGGTSLLPPLSPIFGGVIHQGNLPREVSRY